MLVEMKNVTKKFPGVMALDGVNLSIEKGSVHALLGENGAGKSTLMKILSGTYSEYEGELFLDGNPVRFRTEKDALKSGVAIVPQELNSIPELTIAENIYLGREPTKALGFVDGKRRLEETQNFMNILGLDYEATAKMSELSVAQRQMVEIIKAISRKAKLIIMDEPTSALTEAETTYLFRQIENLKASGTAIIFISHKLDGVYRICDSVTVLRDGKWIGSGKITEYSEDKLISMMVGREVGDVFPVIPKCGDRVVFKAEELSGRGFKNVSFEIKEGEILGFAGMMGAGRTEIARSIFGMAPLLEGKMELEGKSLHIKSTRDAIKQGIVMVSEDRAAYGFVGDRSIADNITIPNGDFLSRGCFLDRKKINEESKKICEKLKVKALDCNTLVGTLSGGNQQKVVLAKWLIRNVKLLILDEPTRGIDIGAKQEIYKLITDLAKAGKAVMLISSELPEVLSMSHRILVLAEGEVVGCFSHEEATQNAVMSAIVKRGVENG